MPPEPMAIMDQYYVLGNPIAHSKSPLIHARFAELTGQSLQYERLLVPLDSFAATLAQLVQAGIKGCNVTVPFKLDAFEAATTRTDRAQLAQAANTLLLRGGTVHADNTDGVGLVNDIQNNAGISLAGRDVLLIGAGGAGAGALAPLLAAGPRRLVLVNRTRAKADALAARHKAHASMKDLLEKTELLSEGLQSLQGSFDVVINASASSLAGAGVPVATSVLKPGALAYDMRILGIDPGLQTSGFGVVDVDGPHLRYVASGTIKTTHLERADLPGRLKVLFEGVCEVVERYQPDAASVEIIFVNVNPQATLLLGQARGACITALVSRELSVTEYTALQLKKAVAGYGKAGKAEMQEMVMRLLKLPSLPGKDAADALGLAITHDLAGADVQPNHQIFVFLGHMFTFFSFRRLCRRGCPWSRP